MSHHSTKHIIGHIGDGLPRCMECRRGLAMRILSVCPSVRLSVKRVIPDKMEER